LAGQVVVVRQSVGEQFEHRIASQGIVIVLIFVAREDAIDTTADHLQERVIGILSRVLQLGRKTAGEVQLPIELSEEKQSSVGRDGFLDRLNQNRFSRRKIEFQIPNILQNHLEPPSVE